jgi:hypothetical protein
MWNRAVWIKSARLSGKGELGAFQQDDSISQKCSNLVERMARLTAKHANQATEINKSRCGIDKLSTCSEVQQVNAMKRSFD